MRSPAFRSSLAGSSGAVRPLWIAAFVAALLLAPACGSFAHDIPSDVTVQAFVKPAGEHLNLLLRVPLNAMRDTEFPERGPGYLDLARVDSSLREAASVWLADAIELYENDMRLPNPLIVDVRVSLQSDKSFASYEQALAHVAGPRLTNDVQVYWNQVMLDVLFEYPVRSDRSRFSIHPGLARLGLQVLTALRFMPPDGALRAFEFIGDPGLVRLDPRWHQAALRFVKLGFFHILDGTDHLLFLFCLVIPFRSLRKLIPVVTSFTVAHSITLIASAYNLAPGFLWFPPLIETLIAMSIVYMALENIVGGIGVQRRWIITFGFGLVHGFGFSFALRQTLQFAGSHLLTSLLSFNVGVELGQLLVLVLLIPFLHVFFRFAVAERTGTIILSALVAHTGWHWMMERGERLRQFPFAWPLFTDAMLASVMRWLMVILIVGGLGAWLAKHWPLKFPLGQPSPRRSLGMDSTRVRTVRKGLETETGGEI
jgi:HupE/UreJ protein